MNYLIGRAPDMQHLLLRAEHRNRIENPVPTPYSKVFEEKIASMKEKQFMEIPGEKSGELIP